LLLLLILSSFFYSTGDELTPGAKYDFKFKDYAPWVFRGLRERFGIDPADYLVRKKRRKEEKWTIFNKCTFQ
jgi:hypothetical protein